MGALSPLAAPRAGLRRPSRSLRTPRARERGHPGSGLSESREPSGASSLWAGQTPWDPAPAVLDWTERSPDGAKPGECRVRAEGSRRPPIPPTLANELGLARRLLGLPEPGHLWPRSAGPAGPLLLTHPEPGGGWVRFFLPPFRERGGPAPSHRPDVSRGGSEDLSEARGRRVQRKKPALGSLGAPPTSFWGLAPNAARKAGRCPHPR